MCGGPHSKSSQIGFPLTVTGLTTSLSEGQSKHVQHCDNTSGFAFKECTPLRNQEPFQSSPALKLLMASFNWVVMRWRGWIYTGELSRERDVRDDVRKMQPERDTIRGFKGEVHTGVKFSHHLLFTLMLLRFGQWCREINLRKSQLI